MVSYHVKELSIDEQTVSLGIQSPQLAVVRHEVLVTPVEICR
jgi:sRNA-binding carbon storage regulator CsrA